MLASAQRAQESQAATPLDVTTADNTRLPSLSLSRPSSHDASSGSLTPGTLRSHSASLASSPVSPAAPTGLGSTQNHHANAPRASILLNPRRSSYRNPSPFAEIGLSDAFRYPLSPAPVVTHIPAVPSSKQREKERERERELREREKEKNKNKQDERIWGIPKNVLTLGLSDINFNSQVAMLGGWGHTGGATTGPTTPPTVSSTKLLTGPATGAENDGQNDGSDSESLADEPMDPEELAALNAIINTRRSMAAAQALVNGTVVFNNRGARAGSLGSSTSTGTRPTLVDQRAESQESVPSMSSLGQTGSSTGSTSGPISPAERSDPLAPKLQRLSSDGMSGIESVGLGATLMGTSPSKQARIRFAPLPQPFAVVDVMSMENGSGTLAQGLAHDNDSNSLRRMDSNNSHADDSASDSDSDDERDHKGKWYLMGMSSSVFKPQYYSRKRSHGRHSSISGAIGQEDHKSETGYSRRKSTGSLGEVIANQSSSAKTWATESNSRASTSSDRDEEDRGRHSSRSRPRSRPSSTSRKHHRSSSRGGTAARSSGDEDEKARRRELIRLSRPGGTGMVTLPDGTRIRARRVNDPGVGQEEPDLNEWGFAGLAKEASRRSLSGHLKAGTDNMATDLLDDDDDDDSDMAWVRRRRREREERARKEKEEAEKAAQATPAALAAADAMDATTPSDIVPVATIPDNGPEEPAPAVPVDLVPATQPASATITSSPQAAEAELVDEKELPAPPQPIAVEELQSMKASEDAMASSIDSLTAEPVSRLSAPHSRVASEPGSLSGSGILIKPGRSNEKPLPARGLALSADQAEEIRRRHEDEVCALGAEVLAQNRRNLQRRATASGGPNKTPGSRHASYTNNIPVGTASSPVKAAKTNSQPGSRLVSRSSTLPPETSPDKINVQSDELPPLALLPKLITSSSRKATTDSERTVMFNSAQPDLASGSVPEQEPTTPVTKILEQPQQVLSPSSSNLSLRDHKRDSSPASSVSRQSSFTDRRNSPYLGKAASVSQSSSLHAPQGSNLSQSPKTHRISLDPKVSVPTPSPWLPRRPDARGMAVVPLPQLGIRPKRPFEGRVWQDDVSDDSDSVAESNVVREPAEETDDEELDAEELAEEERKTAMQKKRATTRAAGQEVVRARNSAKAEAIDVLDGKPSPGKNNASPRHASSSSKSKNVPKRKPSTSSTHSTPMRHIAPKFVRSGEGSAANSDDDEQDLWPAVMSSRHAGTPKPRHILVNLPGGRPGIWDSKKGGGVNAVAAINTVAAARAKAIKQRAQKNKTAGKRESFELPPDWDDEMMDYGWPRSLKGSLY